MATVIRLASPSEEQRQRQDLWSSLSLVTGAPHPLPLRSTPTASPFLETQNMSSPLLPSRALSSSQAHPTLSNRAQPQLRLHLVAEPLLRGTLDCSPHQPAECGQGTSPLLPSLPASSPPCAPCGPMWSHDCSILCYCSLPILVRCALPCAEG